MADTSDGAVPKVKHEGNLAATENATAKASDGLDNHDILKIEVQLITDRIQGEIKEKKEAMEANVVKAIKELDKVDKQLRREWGIHDELVLGGEHAKTYKRSMRKHIMSYLNFEVGNRSRCYDHDLEAYNSFLSNITRARHSYQDQQATELAAKNLEELEEEKRYYKQRLKEVENRAKKVAEEMFADEH
ncbi:hypothetical protein K490DRAFT_60141 [Saccharata proteae CBS 121410]|uniref:Uncharacterized protein n=1 Tax=Saccharata proteae CBS 121410 TaxID=1314787 RepID=A0A9P4HLI4_9PEZI|nr:hypothetical protein K490DRAFT_60141 [Saccharata proteae CBS 121410]